MGGLLERQRSLYTLRLGGMQVGQLKHMVIIESLLPLIVTSLVAAGLGVWMAVVFVNNNSTTLSVDLLNPIYLAVVLGSIVLAVIAIALVLPLLSRLTDPSENQTE